jgi:hypothetical protein
VSAALFQVNSSYCIVVGGGCSSVPGKASVLVTTGKEQWRLLCSKEASVLIETVKEQ